MFADIQGLRCVAVIFVVLFHIWPAYFPSGYLGVDTFFVMSGYLMFIILNRKDFNLANIKVFYFRRIARIVPAYLFTLLLSAIAVWIIYTSNWHPIVAKELWTGATFTSNMLNLPTRGYFDINNNFPVFLHTWSLSVELQFYVLVPIIFYIYKRVEDKRRSVGVVVILFLLLMSMGFQMYPNKDPNITHMHLFSRIWQFLVGFIAAYISLNQEVYKPLTSKEEPSSSGCQSCGPEWYLYSEVFTLKNLITTSLIIQIATPISTSLTLNRILCTFTTAVFLYMRRPSILDNGLIVYIGDISYSIYLIHWPILTIYNYLSFNKDNRVAIADGIILLQASIVTSALVEHSFKHLRDYTVDVKKLLTVLLFFYGLLTLTTVVLMQSYEPIIEPPANETDFDKLIRKAVKQFDNRHTMVMNKSEIHELNRDLVHFVGLFNSANYMNRTRTASTKVYHQMEGDGDLEILVAGNSIAEDLYFGVWAKMRQYYKRVTLYSSSAIIPFRKDRGGDHPADFIDIIQNFDRPIDLLVMRYTLNKVRGKDEYIQKRMTKEVEKFYKDLSKLSPKHIIVGLAEYESGFSHPKFQKWSQNPTDSNPFNFPLKEAEKENQMLDQATTKIDCPKCHFVNFYGRLCDGVQDICTVVDKHGIANYRDSHHSTLFGSFYFAEELIANLQRMGIIV